MDGEISRIINMISLFICLYIYIYIYFLIYRYMYRSLYQISIYASMHAKLLHSCPTPCKPLNVTQPLNVTHQAPLCMGYTRQEERSGFPCPPPGALPKPEIKPRSPVMQADSLPAEPQR